MSYLRKAIALFQLNSSHVDRAVLTGVTGPTLHNLLLALFYPQRRRKQSQSIEGSFFASWPIRSFFCSGSIVCKGLFCSNTAANDRSHSTEWRYSRQALMSLLLSLRWLLRFAEELRRQMAQFWRLYRIWQSADLFGRREARPCNGNIGANFYKKEGLTEGWLEDNY